MESSSPLLELQTALIDTLSEELEIPVVDHVREDLDFPYVVVGEVVDGPDNAHDSFGNDITMTLHVWSSFYGFSQALLNKDMIVRALDHNLDALTLPNHRIVSIRYVSSQTLRDPNPSLRHIPIRFRVNTEQIT